MVKSLPDKPSEIIKQDKIINLIIWPKREQNFQKMTFCKGRNREHLNRIRIINDINLFLDKRRKAIK